MANIDQTESMRFFLAVVEAGGFSAAARRLRIQQSTVSRVIGALEAEYGTTLLMRSTRKMALTEAGTAYATESRRILADLAHLTSKMKNLREEPRGLLRLGLSTAFGKLVVVPLLAEFKRRYPEINLEIHLEDRLVDVIAEGYDVVLRVGESTDSMMTSRKIASVKRGVFVAKSLTRKLGKIREPADLARFPALIFDDHMPAEPKWTFVKGRTRVRVPISSATVVDQVDSLYLLLKDGLGVAYGPLFFAEHGKTADVIERVLPEWGVVHAMESVSNVYALFPGGAKASNKVRVFIDYLVEKVGALSAFSTGSSAP